MVYASHFSQDWKDAAGYGWQFEQPSLDWLTFLEKKDTEIARLNGIYEKLLRKAGVELLKGWAKLEGDHRVGVDGERTLTAKHIVIATGGEPIRPEIPGANLGIISDELFHIREVPKRALIMGGGYIAVEFAGILHYLGCQATVAAKHDVLLHHFDRGTTKFLEDEFRKTCLDLRLNTIAEKLEKHDNGIRAHLTDGSHVDVDLVVYAIGRKPKTKSLGLEKVSVSTNSRGAVLVDEYATSSVPHIHAVGDVTDRYNLTPVAIREGQALAQTLTGKEKVKVHHRHVPTAIFSQPPMASVGLSEEQAKEGGLEFDVYESNFKPLKHTISGRNERAFVKLLVQKETDLVLGLHVVGPEAAEIVQGFAVAMECGATKRDFDRTLGIHPSTAEEIVTMRSRRAN